MRIANRKFEVVAAMASWLLAASAAFAAGGDPLPAPRLVAHYEGGMFSLVPPSTPTGKDEILYAEWNPTYNTLNAVAGNFYGSFTQTPTGADQILKATFNSTFNALQINCLYGCNSPTVIFASSKGAIGRLNFTNNLTAASNGTLTVSLTGSPSFNTGPAQVGDYIQIINGGALSAPSAISSLTYGGANTGTIPSSTTLSGLQSCVTSGSATYSLTESAPSTSTTGSSGGTANQSVAMTAGSCTASGGVSAAAVGFYLGPQGAERFIPNSQTYYVSSVTGNGTSATYTLNIGKAPNLAAVGNTVTFAGLTGANCPAYNLASQSVTGVTATTIVISSALSTTCNSSPNGTAVVSFGTAAAGQLGVDGYFATGATVTVGNFLIDSILPVQDANGFMLSTIVSLTSNGLNATLTDKVPTSFSSAHAFWGPDNHTQLANAVSACPPTLASNSTNGNSGCTIVLDGPGTTYSPDGWYGEATPLNLPSLALQGVPINMMVTCGGGAYAIQSANGYSSGLNFTQDRPPCGLVPFGRIWGVTSGTFNTITQGAELSHMGILDIGTGGSQTYAWGVAAGGFLGQTIAAATLDRVSYYGLSTGFQFEGGATASQSTKVLFNDCLGTYRCGRLLQQAVDTQIWGGEWSGVGQAGLANSSATSINNTSATYAARGIGLEANNQSNTLRIFGTDIQNFGTGIYCYNIQNCNIEPGIRMEEVGQTGLANSDPVVIDGSLAAATWRYDSPEIASNGFAHCFTVTSTVVGQGTAIVDCNGSEPANILNNLASSTSGPLTNFFGTDPANVTSYNPMGQTTSPLAFSSFTTTYAAKSAAAGTAISATSDITLFPFRLDRAVYNVGHIQYYVQAQDSTTTNTYVLGLYGPGCSSGATNVPLAWSLAQTAATWGAASAAHTAALSSSVSLQPGWYCWAWSTGGTIGSGQVWGGDTSGSWPGPFASINTITGGGNTLPSTITAPAFAWSANNMPWFSMYP